MHSKFAMKCFVYFLLLLCCVVFVKTWRPFVFRFSGVKCDKRSQLASFLNCSLTKLKRRQGGLCFSMQFGSELHRPKLEVLIATSRKGQPDFVLANVTDIDGCQFLANKGVMNILQIIRREFTKYSNIPEKCPVSKGTEIHVKNLILDADNFPPYVPETSFFVQVQMWEKGTPIFELIVNGSVEAKTSNSKKIRF